MGASNDNHQALIAAVNSLLKKQSENQPTLQEALEGWEASEPAVMTHSRIHEALGEAGPETIERVAKLFEESGVKVKNDMLTEHDVKALEQWRKLAGIEEI